jgi:ankyrin repeat protein
MMTEAYRKALTAMDAGDIEDLRRVLAEHPAVVAEREEGGAGYFMHATLLHHVAGNPIRGPLPANVVAIARTLIEAGADVRATCGSDHTGDLLGLVASGAQMAESGLYRPMVDLLLESGVSMADDRGVLSTCLYHTVECQKQREVGAYLAAKGAKIDLVLAAALGDPARVSAFVDVHGALTADAHGPFRRDASDRLARGDDAIRQEALTWACLNGRDATVDQLLDLGAAINGFARVAGSSMTPLHAAAWAGWDKTCALLLERGADHTLLETAWANSPIGMAAFCRRHDVVDLFRRRCSGRLSIEDTIAIADLADVEAAIAPLDPNDVPAGIKAPRGILLRNAAVYGRADVVALLLARGADPTLRNPEGKTAYDLAAQRKFGDIMTLLQPAPID